MAEVRSGQLPASGAVDFQAVPLCLQKNAKGGENGTQLASLRQGPISSNAFSCEPRGSQACKSGTRFRRLTCAGDWRRKDRPGGCMIWLLLWERTLVHMKDMYYNWD